jgi:serine/threonine protein kinase
MSSSDDDSRERTVTKPQARVYAAPADVDSEATVIRPGGATAFNAAPGSAPATARAARNDSGNNLPIGTFLGEFEITELIGEGGFGIVYLARDHSLQRRVALKEYMPSALAARTGPMEVSVKSERHRDTFEAGLKSFVNEARLLAQFDHPSLVKVYRFWEANGTAYMVMPFYEGVTLKQQLKDMGAPPNETWLMELLGPLTEALEVIHADQCYHRDIAPDNVILLKGSNRPLLLDFGAARRVIGDMTQALTVILKPGYAPVEQYAEVPGMKQGPWTDVYALAAVVYYAIIGKTPPTSVGRLMNDSFVPLSQEAAGRYSPKFLAAIDRALAVKPEERTQSIGELRHELGLDTMPPPAPRNSTRAEGKRVADAPIKAGASESGGRSKTPLYAGIGVLVLALLGGGLYVLLAPAKKPPATTATMAPVEATAASSVAVAPPPAVTPPLAPTVETTAANQPFDPVRDFQRVVAAQSADFKVDAATTQPQYRIDRDFLSFSVKAEKEGYLYVFLHGSDGVLMQVFPNAMAKNNKVRAGQSLTLPPAKSQWAMKASGPRGVDHFIAIVSAWPRDFSATGLQVQDGYGQASLQTVREAAERAGGATPLFLGKAICEKDCNDTFGAAVFSSEQIN